MKFTKEIKIALVAIVGIIVLFFGLKFLKGLDIFSTDNSYYITFSNINGVAVSTPIYADGYKVGVVKEVDYNYGRQEPIKVKVDIDPKLRVPAGTTAEITSDMLGNVQVNLILGQSPSVIEPGGIIPGDIQAGLLNKVGDLVPILMKMAPKLDSILDNVNRITADKNIPASLSNIQTVTSDLKQTTTQLNTLLATLNRNVPGMAGKVNTVLDNTQTFTGNLAKLDVQGTLDRVNTTLDNVHAFTEKLNSNSGSLGKLMNDASLYDNLNHTVNSADSLVTDLKAHPKRYVHFSVFGKKDK